jgi:hypothetical protein
MLRIMPGSTLQALQASAAGSVHVQRDIRGVRGGHVFPETAWVGISGLPMLGPVVLAITAIGERIRFYDPG